MNFDNEEDRSDRERFCKCVQHWREYGAEGLHQR